MEQAWDHHSHRVLLAGSALGWHLGTWIDGRRDPPTPNRKAHSVTPFAQTMWSLLKPAFCGVWNRAHENLGHQSVVEGTVYVVICHRSPLGEWSACWGTPVGGLGSGSSQTLPMCLFPWLTLLCPVTILYCSFEDDYRPSPGSPASELWTQRERGDPDTGMPVVGLFRTTLLCWNVA